MLNNIYEIEFNDNDDFNFISSKRVFRVSQANFLTYIKAGYFDFYKTWYNPEKETLRHTIFILKSLYPKGQELYDLVVKKYYSYKRNKLFLEKEKSGK